MQRERQLDLREPDSEEKVLANIRNTVLGNLLDLSACGAQSHCLFPQAVSLAVKFSLFSLCELSADETPCHGIFNTEMFPLSRKYLVWTFGLGYIGNPAGE